MQINKFTVFEFSLKFNQLLVDFSPKPPAQQTAAERIANTEDAIYHSLFAAEPLQSTPEGEINIGASETGYLPLAGGEPVRIEGETSFMSSDPYPKPKTLIVNRQKMALTLYWWIVSKNPVPQLPKLMNVCVNNQWLLSS